jgi:hypothetical protein
LAIARTECGDERRHVSKPLQAPEALDGLEDTRGDLVPNSHRHREKRAMACCQAPNTQHQDVEREVGRLGGRPNSGVDAQGPDYERVWPGKLARGATVRRRDVRKW